MNSATPNLEQSRFNMVEQQIRPWEVLNQAVLDLLYLVPRERFVPEQYRALAFSDLEIPLGLSCFPPFSPDCTGKESFK